MRDLDDPTNRDSVHAMLTPGEFVLNKEASTMFAPIIEKMNNAGLQQRAAGNQQYNTGGLVNFLKKHEGYRDKAYQDQAGVWTIGYGRTRNPDGSPIRPGQTTSQSQEDSWLDKRANTDRSATKAFADKHGYDFNDNELDALASFRYNIGNLDQLTAGGTRDKATIMSKLPLYNKAGGKKSEGLVNRRNAELALFQGSGQQQQAPVPRQEAAPPVVHGYDSQPVEAQQQGPSNFGQAFAAARKAHGGGGGTFEYGGQQYTTNIAEEEDPMNRNYGGPIHLNSGGWLGKLFSNEQEEWIPQGKVDWYARDNGVTPEKALRILKQNGGEWPSVGGSASSLSKLQRERASQVQLPGSPGYDRGPNPFVKFSPQWKAFEAQNRNMGGPIHLNSGGWWNSLFDNEDQNAGYADYTQEDFVNEAETFNNPGAQTEGYSIPNLPVAAGGNTAIPQMQAAGVDPRIAPQGSPALGEVPQVDAPPVAPAPGTDEDILQNSSQADEGQPAPPPEIQEIYGDIWNQLDEAGKQEIMKSHGYNDRGEKLGGAVRSGIIGPDSAPSQEYITAQIESGNMSVPQLIESGAPPEMVQAATDQLVNRGGSGLVPPSEIDQQFVADQTPAAEAIASGEVTPAEALEPDTFDPRGKDQRPKVGTAESAAAVKDVVTQNETPEDIAATDAAVETAGGIDAVQAAGQTEAKDPSKMDSVKSSLKEAFGDLFDGKELARAAIMMLGGMATGMSPQQALAFAGKGYINRIDAKETASNKHINDLVKGGEYNNASIAKYKESGDPSDLIAIAESPKRSGNFETFYQNGKRIKGEEVTLANGSKVYVDERGAPINQFSATTDASRAPGTPEYRDRINAESKDYGAQVQNLVDRHGTTKEDGNTFYRTAIEPKKAGRDIAAFALKHNIPPEAMGSIIENAYLDANAASSGDKKVRDITPYLNAQFVEATVGDPTLFQLEGGKTVDGEKVQQVINGISTQVKSRNPERYGGMSNSAISTQIMQVARSNWAKLGTDVQQSYKPRKGETPFMAYLRAELQKGVA